MDLLGRYSNPSILSRIRQILTGQGRDGPSPRTVPPLKQKQIRLTDSEQIEVLERYLAGETAKALASTFGVNRTTIFAILQRAGIESRYRILTDRDVITATEMYESGQSLGSIARHFDVNDGTVLNAFRRAGVPTRARGTNQWTRPAALPQQE